MKRFVIISLGILITSVACQKSDDSDSMLYPKYKIVKVVSDTPIDLNFDGHANTDLTKEIDGWDLTALYFDRTNGYTNIIWMEPQLNDGPLYELLPTEYNGEDIKYQPVGNLFGYSQEANGTISLRRSNVIGTWHYTFSPPRKITIDPRSDNLHFEASQQFLTEKNGIVSVQIEAEYRPVKDYIPEY